MRSLLSANASRSFTRDNENNKKRSESESFGANFTPVVPAHGIFFVIQEITGVILQQRFPLLDMIVLEK